MTGGLAYVLADEAARNRYHADFVQAVACSAEEDAMLRQVLIKHCLVNWSPSAALILNAGPLLPFMRVQPLQLPCAVDQTWPYTAPHPELCCGWQRQSDSLRREYSGGVD